jgi:serine/threonine-protein kinase RsbW
VVDTITSRIVSDAASLREASAWLRERCAAAGLPGDLTDRLELCVNEAVANAMTHGHRDHDRPEIHVCLSCQHDLAEVTLVDDGQPFNPLPGRAPRFADSIDEAQVGGFGLYLLHEFSDGLDYHRDNGRNCLTLRFRRR